MHMKEFGIRQEETLIQEKGTGKGSSCKTPGLNQSRLWTIQIESRQELLYPFRNQKLKALKS